MGIFSSLFKKSQAFALDISDTSVQLLEIRPDGLAVTSAATAEIPPGVVEDGRILDQAALSDIIHATYAHAAPRPPRSLHVVTAIPESQTLITHVTIDTAGSSQNLKDTVFAMAEESLPLNLDEHAWDYEVLATDGTSREVLLAAAPADIVEAYEQTLALAGLKLDVMELESMALTRAVVSPATLAEGAALVIDIGRRSSTLAFLDRYGLQLSVTVHIAGDALTDAIAKKLKIAPDEAETRKRKKGFLDKECVPVLREVLAPLFEEARQARAFYEKKRSRTVTRVILAGGSSALPGIIEEMTTMFSLPVEKGAPLFSIPGREPQQISVVAGLALRAARPMEGINFILPE